MNAELKGLASIYARLAQLLSEDMVEKLKPETDEEEQNIIGESIYMVLGQAKDTAEALGFQNDNPILPPTSNPTGDNKDT